MVAAVAYTDAQSDKPKRAQRRGWKVLGGWSGANKRSVSTVKKEVRDECRRAAGSTRLNTAVAKTHSATKRPKGWRPPPSAEPVLFC